MNVALAQIDAGHRQLMQTMHNDIACPGLQLQQGLHHITMCMSLNVLLMAKHPRTVFGQHRLPERQHHHVSMDNDTGDIHGGPPEVLQFLRLQHRRPRILVFGSVHGVDDYGNIDTAGWQYSKSTPSSRPPIDLPVSVLAF